eukprot:8090030-Alexandrium_andersonii.AAC.1
MRRVCRSSKRCVPPRRCRGRLRVALKRNRGCAGAAAFCEMLGFEFSRRAVGRWGHICACLLYTSAAADDMQGVDLGGR